MRDSKYVGPECATSFARTLCATVFATCNQTLMSTLLQRPPMTYEPVFPNPPCYETCQDYLENCSTLLSLGLFPNICHVHYPKIAPIVEQVAKEYNLPYNVQPTFAHAIWEHGKMLMILGKS